MISHRLWTTIACAAILASCTPVSPIVEDPVKVEAATLISYAIQGDGFEGSFEGIDCDTGLCLALGSGTAPGVGALSIGTWDDSGNPKTATFADSGVVYKFFKDGTGRVERGNALLATFTHTP